MIDDRLRNAFLAGLTELLKEVALYVSRTDRDPYAGGVVRAPHEYDTRTIFVDRLLELLQWRLGPAGNVREEMRVSEDTVRFMDYVGVAEGCVSPMLIVEAKAWDKPYVAARVPGGFEAPVDLIAEGIKHIFRAGADAIDTSPVTELWHKYLDQVRGYVATLKTRHGHDTPRMALTSGQWLVIFTNPVATFVNREVSTADIVILRLEDYISRSAEWVHLLHRSVLAADVPFPVRPTQVPQFVEPTDVLRVFHGLHVHSEATGSPFHGVRPRVLVFPLLLIERNDGVFIAAASFDEFGHPLQYVKEEGEGDDADTSDLGAHLQEVQLAAESNLAACATELGIALSPSSLEDFPGFSGPIARRADWGPTTVKLIQSQHDEWMLATGTATHYLTASPSVGACQFHSWAAARDVGLQFGDRPTFSSSVKPRIIFIDNQDHYCAHITVLDRREDRCQVSSIDSRVCCRTCVYHEKCWSADELAALPCGS